MKKNILGISGSTRKQSTNESILRIMAEMVSKELDMHLFTRIDELPFFNPDLEQQGTQALPAVTEFREAIQQADGVIICTPEYVFSLPGALKNALEWTVSTTVFSFKPVAFVVASASGEKAFEALDLIMSTLVQTPIPPQHKLLIKGGRGKVNQSGDFTDAGTREELTRLIDSFTKSMG